MELIGWRAWFIAQVGGGSNPSYRLQSLGSGGGGVCIWYPGRINVAECPHVKATGRHSGTTHAGSGTHSYLTPAQREEVIHDPRCPGELCSCGFYTAATRDDLIRYAYPRMAAKHIGTRRGGLKIVGAAIGQVALAGKVIPGRQGWRAEKAWATKLYLPTMHYKLAQPLADQYGVEVEFENILTQKGAPA